MQNEFILVQEASSTSSWTANGSRQRQVGHTFSGIPHGYFNKSKQEPARCSPFRKLEQAYSRSWTNLADVEEVVKLSAAHEVDFPATIRQ